MLFRVEHPDGAGLIPEIDPTVFHADCQGLSVWRKAHCRHARTNRKTLLPKAVFGVPDSEIAFGGNSGQKFSVRGQCGCHEFSLNDCDFLWLSWILDIEKIDLTCI